MIFILLQSVAKFGSFGHTDKKLNNWKRLRADHVRIDHRNYCWIEIYFNILKVGFIFFFQNMCLQFFL